MEPDEAAESENETEDAEPEVGAESEIENAKPEA